MLNTHTLQPLFLFSAIIALDSKLCRTIFYGSTEVQLLVKVIKPTCDVGNTRNTNIGKALTNSQAQITLSTEMSRLR